ncbi:MAG: arginine repressor [Clostridiales bacterium]|nr:arginine repressor [Clostridiales bacterium]
MKKERLKKILEIISEYPISTQEELLAKLRESGLDVTQATVSRDIKELRIVKSMESNGQYRYISGASADAEMLGNKFRSIFSHSVKSSDYAGNMLVIHCFNGMAQAACAAFDSMTWDGLVGTIAGDDTVFVLCRTEDIARQMRDEINNVIKNK